MKQFAAVIDASVVIASFVTEAQTSHAERILALELDFVAPDLLLPEIANALWRYQGLTRDRIPRAAEFLERIPSRIRLVPSAPLAPEALAIACALDHPAYDVFYLAHARREGAPLVTLDRRLLKKVRGTPYAGLVASAEQFAKTYSAFLGYRRKRTPRTRRKTNP